MKKFGILILVLIAITIIGKACEDDTVSYYRDLNGNGRQDFGEGVWFEDDDGIHFYD